MNYTYFVNNELNLLYKNSEYFSKLKERSDIFVRNYWLSISDMGNRILSKQYDSLSGFNQVSRN